jgi:hypothetical protein
VAVFFQQGGDDVGAAHYLDLQVDPRVFAVKLGQELIEGVGVDAADHQQAHFADHFIAGFLQGVAHLRDLAVHLAGDGEDLFAGLGQYEARATAGDELAVELFFQAFEGLADGRLSQVQACGGAADAQFLANDAEGAQQVPVQAVVEQRVNIATGFGHGAAQ